MSTNSPSPNSGSSPGSSSGTSGGRAGTVWINAYRVVAPSVPFGGYGLSGLGRENGIDAVNEYTENKSVWVSPRAMLGRARRGSYRASGLAASTAIA
jgi:hypothetical protein